MVGMEVLLKHIDAAEKWAMGIRRELHKCPELGNEEYKTRERIEGELHSLGIITERVLETGLIGTLTLREKESLLDLKNESSFDVENGRYKVIALRADMDALPIKEQVCCGFSSEREGVMHACGHDVHMAVLLGTAKVLSELKEEMNGTIRFIFQPAEETCGGAERMIEKGCLMVDSYNRYFGKNVGGGPPQKSDYIIGIHVKPDLPAGTIGLKYGKVHASSDLFKIIVKGKASHGAYPHEGIDAVVSAAQIISNAQSIVARNVDPINSAVISFGSIQGGIAKNILVDSVIIEGTIRALDRKTRDFLKNRLCEMAEYTAKANRALVEVTFAEGYTELINNNHVVDVVKFAVENFLEEVNKQELKFKENPKLLELKDPTMGVEDFSYFLKEVPGAFIFLGSGFKDKENKGLHSEKFQVNEDCIKIGILVEVLACLKLLDSQSKK